MKAKGHNFSVHQFRADAYDELSKNRNTVPSAVAEMPWDYAIDIDEGVLHRNTCEKVKAEMVRASIIDPKTTGLKLCKCVR
jgi:hypothetical protein